MKRAFVAASVVLFLLAAPAASFAVADEYDDTQAHPLRVATYLIHPIGYAAEWIIFRPFHYLVSSAAPVFGHRPHAENYID